VGKVPGFMRANKEMCCQLNRVPRRVEEVDPSPTEEAAQKGGKQVPRQAEETVSQPLSPLRGSGSFPTLPGAQPPQLAQKRCELGTPVTRRANFIAATARLVYSVLLAFCSTTNFLFQSRHSL